MIVVQKNARNEKNMSKIVKWPSFMPLTFIEVWRFEKLKITKISIEQVAGEQGVANQQHFPYKFLKIFQHSNLLFNVRSLKLCHPAIFEMLFLFLTSVLYWWDHHFSCLARSRDPIMQRDYSRCPFAGKKPKNIVFTGSLLPPQPTCCQCQPCSYSGVWYKHLYKKRSDKKALNIILCVL